jgi:hypothetical protein
VAATWPRPHHRCCEPGQLIRALLSVPSRAPSLSAILPPAVQGGNAGGRGALHSNLGPLNWGVERASGRTGVNVAAVGWQERVSPRA